MIPGARHADPRAEAAQLGSARLGGDSREYIGLVAIEWPASYGGPPVTLPSWRVKITDAETGEQITTVTSFTLHAAAQDLIWAELTMFADTDGTPILAGAPVIDPWPAGDILTGTFAYLVSAMTVAAATAGGGYSEAAR